MENILDGFIDIDVIDPDATSWDKLIEEILRGNVIPVIGSDILFEGGDIHKILLQSIANAYKVRNSPSSFSELIYDNDFLAQTNNQRESIYTIMNGIFKNRTFPASSLLKDVLSIRQFPFVITTSFTPIVESVMRDVWGAELRTLRFNNNPREKQDIKSEADMRKPTVYYMFGRVGEAAHRYALTDTDMLDFCSSWVADTDRRPRFFVSNLKSKYLLMLGNNYSDWLFRFMWYSLKKESAGGGLYTYTKDEKDDLSKFLERNHTFLQKSPQVVVDKIQALLAERLLELEKTKFDKVENNSDIFISYSRSDSAIVEALYEHLTQMGKTVWYDRNDITHGGNFMDEIKKGIKTARYFLPIFTQNILNEKNASHVYRIEWDEAIEMGRSLGRTFIIPVAEEGFDFYKASIPERMQQHNAIMFSAGMELREVAEKIIHTMNKE